jgi:hypothetical protein
LEHGFLFRAHDPCRFDALHLLKLCVSEPLSFIVFARFCVAIAVARLRIIVDFRRR